MSREVLRDRRRRLLASAVRKERWASLSMPTGPPVHASPVCAPEGNLVQLFSKTLAATRVHGNIITMLPRKIGFGQRGDGSKFMRSLPWPTYCSSLIADVRKQTGCDVGAIEARLYDQPGDTPLTLDVHPVVMLGAPLDLVLVDEGTEVAVVSPLDHPAVATRILRPLLVSNPGPDRAAIVRGTRGRSFTLTFKPRAATLPTPPPPPTPPAPGSAT